MQNSELIHILADGLSPGMIFGIVIVIIIAAANIMAKSKQSQETQEKVRGDRQQRTRGQSQRTLEEIIQENIRRGEAEPGQQRQQRSPKKKQKSRQQTPVPPPLPPELAKRAAPVEDDPPRANSTRATSSEAARNVRLLLRSTGIREAIMLSEVLGKPNSLKDK